MCEKKLLIAHRLHDDVINVQTFAVNLSRIIVFKIKKEFLILKKNICVTPFPDAPLRLAFDWHGDYVIRKSMCDQQLFFTHLATRKLSNTSFPKWLSLNFSRSFFSELRLFSPQTLIFRFSV